MIRLTCTDLAIQGSEDIERLVAILENQLTTDAHTDTVIVFDDSVTAYFNDENDVTIDNFSKL